MKTTTRIQTWTTIGLLAAGLASCGTKTELTPKQLAEQTKPGTVMIQAMHKAEIAVPDYEVNQAKLDQYQKKLVQQVQNGSLTSEEQVFAAVLQEMLSHPLDYFQPTNQIIREDAEVTATGTGAIVTPDGYIVTNAHVVTSEDDSLKQMLAESALQDVAVSGCQNELATLSDEWSQAAIGQTIGTDNFKQMCLAGLMQYFAHYMELSEVETKIYTAIGAVTPNEDITKNGFVTEVKTIGEPTPGKDVAILKINGNNLPTVLLGDDKPIESGDPLYILGYPADAFTNDNKANEPSLTAGLVSARKTMPDDWDVLQTDAAMNHGNSGGPALDNQGEMIGIATFGVVDAETKAAVDGVNFAVPTSVVQEFLQKVNVQPQEGPLSVQYRQGIKKFNAQQYRQALDIFRKIHEVNAQFPYVDRYISDSRSQIDAGKDKSLPLWLMVAVPTGLAISSVGLWRKRRSINASKPAIGDAQLDASPTVPEPTAPEPTASSSTASDKVVDLAPHPSTKG